MKLKSKAFTLVELLVVITIIAILATLSFVSFQGFTRDARDATRLGQLDQIQKGLESYIIDNAVYPESNNPITITASGTIISYQGTFSEQQSKLINMSPLPLDPLDKTEYTYLTTASKDKYQLLAFMEGKEYKQTVLINNPSLTLPLSLMEGNRVYASDYTSRYPKVSGNNLGILVEATTNQPITTTIDVVTYTGSNLKAILSNKANGTIIGTGTKLVALKNTTNTGDYDPSLIAYYDMETTVGSGLLADLSGNGNHGTGSGGVIIGGMDGQNGKATMFNSGSAQFIKVYDTELLRNYSKGITLNVLSYTDFYTQPGQFLVEKFSSGTTINYSYGNYLSCWSSKCTNLDPVLGFYGTFSGDIVKSNFVSYDYSKKYIITTTVFNGNELKSYVNGNLVTSTGGIGNIRNTEGNLFIGGWMSDNNGLTGKYYNGMIDDVRIYNRALSDGEILDLYKTLK